MVLVVAMEDDRIDAEGGWTLEIRPRNRLFAANSAEIWLYAPLDLIFFCHHENTRA